MKKKLWKPRSVACCRRDYSKNALIVMGGSADTVAIATGCTHTM